MEALITKNQRRIEMRANTSHPEVFRSNTVSHAEKSVFVLTENRPLSRECLYICKALRSWQSILQFFSSASSIHRGGLTSPKTAQQDTNKLGWGSEGSTCSSGWMPFWGPRVSPRGGLLNSNQEGGIFFELSSLSLTLGKVPALVFLFDWNV